MEKAEPVGELRLQLDRWDIVGIHSAMLKLKVPSGNYPVYLQPPISAAQGDVSVDVKQTAEYSYGYQQALQDVALRATPADGSLS
jgi:hypothetical protein